MVESNIDQGVTPEQLDQLRIDDMMSADIFFSSAAAVIGRKVLPKITEPVVPLVDDAAKWIVEDVPAVINKVSEVNHHKSPNLG